MAKDYKPGKQWNWYNFWICLAVGFFGQMAFGTPSAIIGTTLAQPAFLIYMGLLDPETEELTANANSLIGATSGVFQAGAFFGVLVGSWVMDKYGRKAGVMYCVILSIIGSTLLAAAQNIAMFITFRFFSGAGSWSMNALIPVYSAELAPPKLRGLFVGMNGMGITVGYAMASYMGLAFYYSPHPAVQWRGPLGLALVWPIFMLVTLLFVPESPRWLLMVGRVEEARKITMKLHHIKGDPDQEYARGEFYQMQKQTEFDMKLDSSWKAVFTKPNYRKRAVLAIGFAFIGQSTAVLIINNYGPTVYKALGYDTLNQLILQCGWITMGIPANLIGAILMDRVGRKPLMLTGVIGCCACLIVEAAMIAQFASPVPAVDPNRAGLRAGVAAFYVFLLFYGCGIDVAGFVYYGEIWPNHLRAKGVALAVGTIAISDLVYLQAASTAFANIGWKFFLLFIILSGLGAVWVWVFLPETKGVPLEEMAVLFGDSEEVVVFSENIHVDHTTHELVVDPRGESSISQAGEHEGTKHRVPHVPDNEKAQESVVDHVSA
ncbi:uncharacterized protein Z520_05279 [Fonsecaea multimorphosa CBS 102226]|uniref:Major facilitator superfamily (MFS) profile domain-containing protein n=1 Tax=Fonsecaea multimorphosa CBS 102226 TaxID=1442371 RepID=A0A0D2KQ09_9EURO|nr:uncharacterized protein Z520_05279 [Fonsecaea multimorphosa CBS 102226]KIX98818.1 hypothetical protein Z520_05279 [Fonsecaea multimorphosa CBS 102226]OAL25098.1 hypothetical protein AYO22_04975 [Fonsecaea multimorphosa]